MIIMRNINSLNNSIIKELIKIRKGATAKRLGRFLIDGHREILSAKQGEFEIEELFLCPELAKKNKKELTIDLKIKTTILSENAFRKIAYKENPDGFIALVKRKFYNFKDIKLKNNPLIIVLEAIEKPGNLGAIIRTARAVGVDAIILNNQETDIFNANIIRSSEGLIFSTVLVLASLEETAAWLKQKGIKILATETRAQNRHYDTDMSVPTALVLGSESRGLSEKWLKTADKKISIPMEAGIDSLNVSVSAGILVFEAKRQRDKKISKKI